MGVWSGKFSGFDAWESDKTVATVGALELARQNMGMGRNDTIAGHIMASILRLVSIVGCTNYDIKPTDNMAITVLLLLVITVDHNHTTSVKCK